MKFMTNIVVAVMVGAATVPALAQFSGPSARSDFNRRRHSADVRLGSYVVLTGNVVSHLRGDYFTFRDTTGEIRVEIEGAFGRDALLLRKPMFAFLANSIADRPAGTSGSNRWRPCNLAAKSHRRSTTTRAEA